MRDVGHLVRRQLEPQWTPVRAAAVLASIERRRRRHRATTSAFAFAAVALLAVGARVATARRHDVAAMRMPSGASSAAVVASASPARASTPVLSPNGELGAASSEAVVTPLGPDADVVADSESVGSSYVLRKGGARFSVVHDESRVFRVRVGQLVVEDLGTVFTVVRAAPNRTDVAVEHGRVRVTCGASVAELETGERRTFECEPAAGEGDARNERASGGAARASAPWRRLAESGRYRDAFESLSRAGSGAVRDETRDLLLAADAARLSGHPREAVPYLESVLRGHADDPRSGLAAFTLGRVLLDELGRPADAAAAFERGRAASGPLAEDALAREVEAWSRAGDAARAHALALEYQRMYPNGWRSKAVAKFGGLE